MRYCYTFQVILLFLFVITLISGRALYYDQLDDDINLKSFSNEDDESDTNVSLDSYEERKFHERSIFSSSRPPHILAAHTRQALIDILQKAIDQGWKPNLKHYIPATRFGRHRR